MTAFITNRTLLLAFAFAACSAGAAFGQLKAWPGDNPNTAAPSSPPVQQPMSAPMSAPIGLGMGGPGAPMGGPPGGTMSAPPPEVQQCLARFTKFREEVENRNKIAKAGNDRKVPREEMCKLITDIVTAEVRWIKFTEDNTARCGIPSEVVRQLKSNHVKVVGVKKMACATGPAGGAPAAPSLSEALGTSRLPVSESTSRGGTLDTLSGNPIR